MTTVIDSLVLELGLDASKFTKGQRDALDAFKKTQEEAVKGGKAVEEQSRKSLTALGGIKTQAIELFAAFAGGIGIKEFITSTINAGSSVGRLSRAIGVSATEISRWQGVAQEFGSTGENMAGAFKSLSNVFTAWQVGGPEAPQIMQMFRVINTEAERLDKNNAKTIDGTKGVSAAMKALADNLKIIHDLNSDPNTASYLAGKIPGMDAGLFDFLVTGSDNVAAALSRVVGMTQKEADAAGELDRQWNHLIVTSTRWAQSNLLKTLATDTQDLKMITGWIDGLFGTHLSASFAASPVNNSRTSIGSPATTPNQSYRSAIASIESRGSGGYAAIGPVTSSGDRAYGKYQVMGNNIGPWSQAALGRTITPQEFMASPALQDAIFDHRFGQYVKQFGNPQDAASAWLTGKPLSAGANLRDQYGTSGADYARRFTANLGGGSSNSTTMNFNGPINLPGVQNPTDFTNKLRDLGLKRQAEANQSSVGGE